MATITEYIKPILKGENLSFEQAEQLLDTIFGGEVSEIQVAAFLAAMETKTATAAELAGLAKSLRKHALAVKVDIENLVDTCGTGGGAIKTCNISTAAAIVAALPVRCRRAREGERCSRLCLQWRGSWPRSSPKARPPRTI